VKPDELRKRANAAEFLHRFGISAPFGPVTMIPPPDEAVFKTFMLGSGMIYRPNFSRGREVTVHTEGDFLELQREGWRSTTKTGD
jgi:hypothetical protein